MANPFNINLGGPALLKIKAILQDEKAELEHLESLCSFGPAIEAGKRNIASVSALIANIDEILNRNALNRIKEPETSDEENRRLLKELTDGSRVIVPKTIEHARNMYRVAFGVLQQLEK